jgi:hypothetical protein
MKHNKSWYSVMISLLLIAFILVLTSWIFRLVLNEMRLNRTVWDYFKAYAGAESAQELALLEIRQKWYWFNWIVKPKSPKSFLLLRDSSDYNPNRDVMISYYNDWRVNSYSWELAPLSYDILPLFYIDDDGDHKTTNISMSISSWVPSELSWNVIWRDAWVSGIGSNLIWSKKTMQNGEFVYNTSSVNDFLVSSNTNYLILFNSSSSTPIRYSLNSNITNEFFTKPRLDIFSTWEIGEYKQNLKTRVDNTEMLSILKYSIFSN